MKRKRKKLRDNHRSQKQQSAHGKPVFESLEPRLLLNAVPYIQDFSLGKPNAAAGWDYYSDNEGRIEVVNGRLRMDDTTGNTTYSSNEAILHVDLTSKTGVTLTLDHWSLADENDALPASFAGRFKGDGIALSVDGQNWVKVTDLNANVTNQTFNLDPVVQQAKIAANSANLTDVQIKFQQYDNYPASTDGREFDNIKIQATTVVAQPIPYSQDFTLGKPDANAGWEYYSDNEGRIAVVGGRLRMDDITGNSIYSSNEAILHVNLTNTTGVTLSLDHWSLADEVDNLPNSFVGRFKGDGIALSVDGQNWVKVTDLSVDFTNQTFNLDTIIQQAKIAASSTDLSNVRIKFQQYDNYPANTDGREFDNIKVKATSIAPEIEILGNGQSITDGDITPSLSDHTDFGGVHQGSSLIRTFTIRNTGAAALNLTGNPKVQWTGSSDFTIIQQPVSPIAPGGSTTFQVRFSPTSSGIKTATIQIANNDSNENPYDFVIRGTGLLPVPQAIPYIQTFTSGKPGGAGGWQYYSDNEGRIEVVSGRLRMDDIADNSIYSSNEAILHVNLTGKTGVTLTLDHWSLADEVDNLPNSFVGQFKGDGIALSVDGQNWVKVTDLTINFTNQTFNLDSVLQQAKIAAGSTDVSNVRIKFQQYDNQSASTDGREFDNIVVNFGANQAPIISSATASPSTISDTQTSQLQVVAYDPDSGPNTLTYSWSLPTGAGSLNNPNIVNPIYTPPNVGSTQTFTLTVNVSDGLATASKTVNITVTDTVPVNQAPVISSVTASPSTISDTQTSQLQVVAYDPDSGPNALTYSWSLPTGAGSLNNPNIVNPIYTPPNVGSTQTFTLTVNVSDGLATASKTVNITVTDTVLVNQAPVISSVTASPSTISDTQTSQLQVVAYDPDSGPNALTYSWSVPTGAGSLNNPNIVNPIYTPPNVGSTQTFTLTVNVSDGLATTSKTVNITVTDTVPVNQAPVISSVTASPSTISDTQTSQLQVVAYDPDSGPNTLTYSWSVPTGAGSLNNPNIVNPIYTPPNVGSTQTFTLTVNVSDGLATTSKTVNITVTDTVPVNQAPVISSVTASPSTISDTQTSQLQVVAYDPDSGPNTLTYSWSVPTGAGSLNNPNIVNPIYTPPNVGSTQTFTLTVNVSDGLATTSKTVNITVTDTAPGPQILLSEDFNDGNYNGWALVEQGTQGGPMVWSAASGAMVQSSNVHSPPPHLVAKLGTFAYWQAGTGWTDYTSTVTIKSTDNDAIGVMFRYQDENNYYRFIWDKERTSRALVKCENGVFSILAEDSIQYAIGQSYQVKIAAQGSSLQVSIDGSPVFSVNDSTFSSGTIALYSWGNAGSHFDNITVEGPSGANQAPVISSVTASPSTISEAQTSQLQVVAYDPDSGPNALTYSWSVPTGAGSLNNPNIVNPIYTPPNVGSTQTFTLTVNVSDGLATTSKTVNITVTDTVPVNQAPIISSVTASPSTISDTQTSQLQVVAYDPDSGPNPLTYSWSVPTGAGSLNNPNIVNPIYTPPNVGSTQTFTLTVNVSDGLATTSKTVNITVTDTAPGPQILLSENFNDFNYNGWALVEQGTLGGPMVWSAASGAMVQSSNVHSPPPHLVSKLGTFAYWQAGTGWTDYTTTVTIKSTDNDAIGVMFRYQDENNYYRFIWDKERNSRALVKNVNGVFTILAEDFVPYVIGKSYQVKIAAQGSSLQVSIDGSPVFSVNDSAFSSGTIAMYSWGNAGSHFDDITVEGPSGANQAPVISSVTASPSTISDTQTSQLQVVSYDPDSGPNALTYSWSVPTGAGSLNNPNIVNPIYTPPNVGSTQTFTLTVNVSDGLATTSKTVNITVTDTVPGPQILLSENFNDGNYNGWSLVEQGTQGGPMAWSAASGVMVQSSNVHAPVANGISKLGTYAYWQAGSGWTDYTSTVTMKSTDNDGIGVMFRYQDENNYYRFIWDMERNSRALVKNVNGVFTILAEDFVPYVIGKSYQVKIAAQGSLLQVSIDGSPVFSINDSTFSSGTIALYSWGNAGSHFDNITVST